MFCLCHREFNIIYERSISEKLTETDVKHCPFSDRLSSLHRETSRSATINRIIAFPGREPFFLIININILTEIRLAPLGSRFLGIDYSDTKFPAFVFYDTPMIPQTFLYLLVNMKCIFMENHFPLLLFLSNSFFDASFMGMTLGRCIISKSPGISFLDINGCFISAFESFDLFIQVINPSRFEFFMKLEGLLPFSDIRFFQPMNFGDQILQPVNFS